MLYALFIVYYVICLAKIGTTLDDELLLRNLSMKLLCLSFTALGIHYITEL